MPPKQNPFLPIPLDPHQRQSSTVAETAPQVPKHHSKYIPTGAASAANASGSLQTALSKVTQLEAFSPTQEILAPASLPIEV